MRTGQRFVGWAMALWAAVLLAGTVPAVAKPSGPTGAHGQEHYQRPALNWFDFTHPDVVPVLALVINSGLLVLLLVVLGRKRVRQYLSERQRRVQEEIDAAWEEKLRSEGRLRGLKARAAHLDEEIKTLRDELMLIGYNERERLLRDARQRAEKIRLEAEAMVREEERRFRAEVRRRIIDLAVEEARAVLRQRLTAADHSRLAEEFLRRMPVEEAEPR